MRRKSRSERNQLELFRALPGDLAPCEAQDLMACPFFSLAKSKRIVPIDFRAGAISVWVEPVPEHGGATIWDADVLIWAASQFVEARDAGLKPSRLMAATPYEILPRHQRARLRSPQSGPRPTRAVFLAVHNLQRGFPVRPQALTLQVNGAAA